MKSVRKPIALLITLALTLSLVSCAVYKNSGADGGSGGGYGGGYGGGLIGSAGGESASGPSAPGDATSGTLDSGITDDSVDDAETTDEEGEKAPEKEEIIKRPAGLITAGAWNDNENYRYWKTLFEQGEEKNGKFFSFTTESSWGFDSYGRLKVEVTLDGEDGKPVAGASVTARDSNDEIVYSAVTDSNGIAYLFTGGEGGKLTVDSGAFSDTVLYTGTADEEISVKLKGSSEKRNVIDIMFVVDVTGSMGDELLYLKNELSDVINRVAENDKNTVINLALLFYRDNEDDVPFAYYDFVDVTNPYGLASQQANLNSQSAKGGGDYPEAVDEALLMAVSKQWNTSATTKLIFHVLDAPPHNAKSNQETFMNAVRIAADKGIRISPIICSGTDLETEYVMRQAAVYTAGTFIFVTDDSGIGNSHYDPELPNVTVEALNSLLVRLIDGYHTGVFDDPVYWKEEQLNKNAG